MPYDNDLHLAGDESADRLLSTNPLALMIGMLLDQQVTGSDATDPGRAQPLSSG